MHTLMITKLHHHTTTGFRMAMGLPIDQAIDRIVASARELDAAAEKTSQPQSFGQKIAQAFKAKLAKQQPRTTADAHNESFGEQIKKAVEKKSGAKRHKEYAKRERDRYEQQRKCAKGE